MGIYQILTNFMRSIDHLGDKFRSSEIYHGESCIWCTIKKRKLITHVEEYQHPSGLDLKVSKENIKKKALLVGINYQGKINADVPISKMSRFLKDSCFFTDIRVMSENNLYKPTKKNIYQQFEWLLQDNSPGDILFFVYVGGSKFSANGNSALLPTDHVSGGYITAQNMQTRLFSRISDCTHLTCIMDCSDTCIQLPITLMSSNNTILSFDNVDIESRGSIIGITMSAGVNGVYPVGVICPAIISAVKKRNHRITLVNLLHDITDILQRQFVVTLPRMLISRNIKPDRYYFSLTNV